VRSIIDDTSIKIKNKDRVFDSSALPFDYGEEFVLTETSDLNLTTPNIKTYFSLKTAFECIATDSIWQCPAF
jgi:hypothetical protein